MAADTVGNWEGVKSNSKKIIRCDAALIGYSGSTVDAMVFVKWWSEGADLKALPEFRQYGANDAPDFVVMIARPDEPLTWCAQHFQFDEIRDEFWAIGSGSQSALGAMHMGADAAEAVRIATLVDYSTNGDVQVERLDGEPRPLMLHATFDAKAAGVGVLEVKAKG